MTTGPIRRSWSSAPTSTTRSSRRAFPSAFRASQSSAGPSASGSISTRRTGPRISAASSRCPDNLPQPLALRYHGHQFRVYNPDIGDGRGFLFAQLRDDRRPPARPRHQGLGPDAVQPRRRRPADAEGRGARDPRHRDARGARRQHLEDLLADRDRRGAGARRRALADPLGGARACSHSHIRIGTFQRLAFLGETDEHRAS